MSVPIDAILLTYGAFCLDKGTSCSNGSANHCTMSSSLASYGGSVLLEAAIQATARRRHRDQGAFYRRGGALVLPIGDLLDEGGASEST